ncbi:MAG: tRNA (adenosine(37)-N6)-threonylcarbamoyltransferase complex ATPase subunit type 1 TsaE, partial [Bacteroidota bacterium]
MQFEVSKPDELAAVSEFLVANDQDVPVWIFRGEMGAGKTTLIKQICEDLEVVDIVNSPTFSIVNEYLTEEDRSVYHFDFYRIKDEQEAFDVGTTEYLESGEL